MTPLAVALFLIGLVPMVCTLGLKSRLRNYLGIRLSIHHQWIRSSRNRNLQLKIVRRQPSWVLLPSIKTLDVNSTLPV